MGQRSRPTHTTGWSWPLTLWHVIRASRRARGGHSDPWDGYWAGVTRTGDGGDVLWDASSSDEPTRYADLLHHHSDTALPVVDIGCGNGRLTRALAARFPRAIGTDLSAHAITRARAESGGTTGCEFRVEDMTAPGAAARFTAELGDCNVLVRGVLHAMPPQKQRHLAAAIAGLAGARGTVLIAETNHPGSLLSYLQRLGAGPSGLPAALERVLAAGLPRPSRFGPEQLDRCFPTHLWARLHVDDTGSITTVPGGAEAHAAVLVPSCVAVLRRASAATAGARL